MSSTGGQVVVMNVVTIPEESVEGFEQAFADRERLLSEAPGFAGFELLRREGEHEYAVLSRWESRDAFQAWVRSDLFKKAHSGEGRRNFGGHSEVRVYDVLDYEVAN